MQIIIQSLHFTAGRILTNYVDEKVSKLSHFYPRILAAEVCLRIDSPHTPQNKVCEIRLIVPGKDMFAIRNCKTFEEAIHETVDALKEQIRKHKFAVHTDKKYYPNYLEQDFSSN